MGQCGGRGGAALALEALVGGRLSSSDVSAGANVAAESKHYESKCVNTELVAVSVSDEGWLQALPAQPSDPASPQMLGKQDLSAKMGGPPSGCENRDAACPGLENAQGCGREEHGWLLSTWPDSAAGRAALRRPSGPRGQALWSRCGAEVREVR